jgi:mRNA-degrading endonuclease RelE of RelBE toxin-antitoxin system
MNKPPVTVRFADEFLAETRSLKKRYPHIQKDVDPLIEQLERGETPGDRIQFPGAILYKQRVKNSDARRGKSGGYRVIYYLRAADDTITLIAIYSKSDQSDMSDHEIAHRLDNLKDP